MTQKTTAADGLLDEMDSVPVPRTRRKPMVWEKLGEGKDPEFGKLYFITNGTSYSTGELDTIKKTSEGREFFWIITGVDEPRSGSTHYCEPQMP